MILPLQQAVRTALQNTLATLYGTSAVPATLVIETPPSRALGDIALPCAFELARTLRKAPRAIAQEIVAALPAIPGVSRIEAVGGGYINVFLDRAAFLRGNLGHASVAALAARPKTIVEHTAINPNKAAHIGHLRNAILGDTVGRLLRFLGTPVEIQNYIDDTGVQVADVVVGFEHLEHRTLDEVKALAAGERFDYDCWDLYARVTEWYDADKSRIGIRKATLHAIEHGGNATAAMGAVVADAIVRCHLRTMGRLHIDYDLLSWEGDILRLHFWATAFDILKRNGTVYLQQEGKLKGCWVMEIDEVLLARIASGFTRRSRSAKMRSLRSTFSVAASITRSQSPSASSEVTVVMQAIAAAFCSALILSFLISRSRLAEMVASPRCTCASPTSIITTARPATANTWVMPFPIVPAPTTPILPIVIALVLRTGI